MRNAVIRKKRLRAQRIVDDYMRMPSRLIIPQVRSGWTEELEHANERLWAL